MTEPTNTGGLSVRSFRGRSGVAELYGEWQNLMDRVGRQCFYHQPEWFEAFLRAYPEFGDSIVLLGIYRDTGLIAVIPLQLRRRGRFLTILEVSLPVTHQLYMPDIAVADNEDASVLIEYCLEHLHDEIGEQWHVFAARETMADSLISGAFEGLTRYRKSSRPVRECSLIPVMPYEDALAAMKAKARQNLIRRRKRLNESADMRFSVETTPEEVSKCFAEFVELEASGWKGGKGKLRGRGGRPLAIKLNPNKRQFYQRALEELAKRGVVELHCLRVDGALIAAKIWLIFGGTCFALKTAYDERYGRYSPGMLTFDAAFRHQARKGNIRRINPLFKQESLHGWRPDVVWCRTLLAFNRNIGGRLAWFGYRLASRGRH